MSHLSRDPDDLEWLPYQDLHGSRTALHPEHGPCFICEGQYLVHEALKAHRSNLVRVLSVLTQASHASRWQGLLPERVSLLTADKARMEALLGFSFHRGVLCCVQCPPEPPESRILEAQRLVVLPRLDNVDNLGQILRTAAALGVDAVLTGQGPGAFERRTVRVSMGAAWRIPVRQSDDLPGWLERWKAHQSGDVVGAVLTPTAQDILTWHPAPRTALVLGPEDCGLDPEWHARCDRHVIIPMAREMDSLNVAAAGAILMHRMMAGG